MSDNLTTRQKADVMMAYVRGAQIEFKPRLARDRWYFTAEPRWNWETAYYRVYDHENDHRLEQFKQNQRNAKEADRTDQG